MQIYDREWSDNYERRANGAMPGREGLYRLCRASFLGLRESARILVVGCGSGEEILALARQFPRVTLTGIDPSEAMLDLCRERVAAAGFAQRVALHATDLAHFEADEVFDAATSILVAQHLPDAEAAEFFVAIGARLAPGARLYSADLHIAAGQDRERMLALWRAQAEMAGNEPDLLDGMMEKFRGEIRPRDESEIVAFLAGAGFTDVLKPFSSLLYGAWSCRARS